MKNKIYIKDWLRLKPYDKQTSTDGYYLKLANEIRVVLSKNKVFTSLMDLDNNDIKLLSCFLSSYFEDIISGTNIWMAFLHIHKRFYKKPLPFYDTETYDEGEINHQDIAFLIWYFLNTLQEENFISPYHIFSDGISASVMLILEREYEYAPENEYLRSFYTIDEDETDYYVIREFMIRLFSNTYLFITDTAVRLHEQLQGVVEQYSGQENMLMFLNEIRALFTHNAYTQLMSLQGKEWAAEVLGKAHPLAEALINMSDKIFGHFLYKGQDDEHISLEHIASGKAFKLAKKSFDHASNLTETDTIVTMGIIRWRDEWWFSGIFTQTEFNTDFVLKEKNSIKSISSVSFLDDDKHDKTEMLQQHLEAFKAFNNGDQIAFLPADEIEDFIRSATEYFNNTLDITEKDREEAQARSRKEGYFGGEDNSLDYSDVAASGLVFFNPNSGIEIALDINSAFPLDNNPYFSDEDSQDDTVFMLMSNEFSRELIMFCIEHCKDSLPFFKDEIGEKYLENIDFLLRFWKGKNYHSKPLITFTGQEEHQL